MHYLVFLFKQTSNHLILFSFIAWILPCCQLHFRKRYNNLKQKVIFLAVSDDPRWLKVKTSCYPKYYSCCPLTKHIILGMQSKLTHSQTLDNCKKTLIFKFRKWLKLLWNRRRGGSPFLEIVHNCCEIFCHFLRWLP